MRRDDFPDGSAHVPPAESADTGLDIDLLEISFMRRSVRPQWVVRYFYAHLFTNHPEVRPMFPADMEPQRDRLFSALTTIVGRVRDLPKLADYLTQLGRSHQRRFNLRPEHFDAVGTSLIATLKFLAGSTWSEAEEKTWLAAYTLIAEVMQQGAELERPTQRPAHRHPIDQR